MSLVPRSNPENVPQVKTRSDVVQQTNAGLEELKEMLAKQQFEKLAVTLIEKESRGGIMQKDIDAFVQGLSQKERDDLVKALLPKENEAGGEKARNLRQKLMKLDQEVPGGAGAQPDVGERARQILGFVDQIAGKVNLGPLMANLGPLQALMPKGQGVNNFAKNLGVGLVAKLIEGVAKSLRGLVPGAEGILATVRDLRVAQLQASGAKAEAVKVFVAGYNKWMENPVGNGPASPADAQKFLQPGTPSEGQKAPQVASTILKKIEKEQAVSFPGGFALEINPKEKGPEFTAAGQKRRLSLGKKSVTTVSLESEDGKPDVLVIETADKKTAKIEALKIQEAVAAKKPTVLSSDGVEIELASITA